MSCVFLLNFTWSFGMPDAKEGGRSRRIDIKNSFGENRMNRPQKVKEIYSELRLMLGDKYSPQELLESAALLIEVVEDDYSMTFDKLQDFYVPFKEKSVDEIIATDGWNVLSNEDWWRQKEGEDDALSLQSRMQLKNYGLEVAA
jgi:hypothetical protein